MDCSLFGEEDLPLQAHVALQYITHNVDSRSVFKLGLNRVANYLGVLTTEAKEPYGLLLDAGALEPQEIQGVTVHVLAIPCICQERLGFPRENRSKALKEKSRAAIAYSLLDNSNSSSSRIRNIRKDVPHLDTKRVEAWNPQTFARYFGQKLLMECFAYAGPVNYRAVATNIQKWRRQNVKPQVILAMIDTFCANPSRWCRNGSPAWRAFIYNSSRLQFEAERKVEVTVDREAPAEHWTGSDAETSLASRRLIRRAPQQAGT